MPTATATTTTTSFSALPLKPLDGPSSSPLSILPTLRSLYPRAARAFLQRDVSLTHSLLSSAFSLIQPPAAISNVNDTLSSQRRKWDILRITFETTIYSSPPGQELPPSLRANLMLSSESLIASLHSRSLHMFTPSDSLQRTTSAFLPAQIVVTLVLSSLKLDRPEVGRGIIEDWLAKRNPEVDAEDPAGYAKVLELYCLHVLPRLQDLEYAQDFLAYESQLPSGVRQQMTASVRQLLAEAASTSQAALTVDQSSSSASTRSPSPTLSDSSTSSSSTHTATPRSPRTGTKGRIHTLGPLTPSQTPTPKPREDTAPSYSVSSSSIASTATSRTVTPHNAERDHSPKGRAGKARQGTLRPSTFTNGHANGHAVTPEKSRSRSSSSRPGPLRRRTSLSDPTTDAPSRPPSLYTLIRASLDTLIQSTSRSRVVLYAVLFVVVPIVSFVFRRRRRSAAGTPNSHGSGGIVGAQNRAVDAVRRRLRGVDGQRGVVGKLWEEVARALLDTVRMAGRGLV